MRVASFFYFFSFFIFFFLLPWKNKHSSSPLYSPHLPTTPLHSDSWKCGGGGVGSGGGDTSLPRFPPPLSAPSGIIRGSFVCDYRFYLRPASHTNNILSATPSSPPFSLLPPPLALSVYPHCFKTQKAKKKEKRTNTHTQTHTAVKKNSARSFSPS